MNRLARLFVVIGMLPLLGTSLQTAHSAEQSSYQVAQASFDIFVDGRGRRFLVDPETGQVVGRANRNARFTRRDRLRAQRALRRDRRRARINREFDDNFDVYEDEDWVPRRRNRNRRRNNGGGFYLDELDRNDRRVQRRRENRRRRYQDRDSVRTAPKGQKRQRLASLPKDDRPVAQVPRLDGMPKPKFNASQMAELQIFLDREGFSPGVIDGKWGSNVARAALAWKKATGSKSNLGRKDTLQRLIAKSGGRGFTSYTITAKDAAGPFVQRIPIDYARKAQLKALSFTSAAELLAEKFHMSEAYLRKLNPGKRFGRAGTTIKVVAPGNPISRKVHYIVADKGNRQLRAFDRNGKLVAAYPATIGSASTPSPSGTHSVERIALNPEYTYNPKKNFQQGNNNKILRISPGPNGPVGSVWIALSKPTYGIHGTPNPSKIGKTSSHGCIRLTNWDAQELAKIVRKGVTVKFVE